ncbi:histidine kinase, partial [Faecalibacterium sp. DFI.5.82]|uniref:sensor histidine kinase n=1 Tax=Faecalibacterium sp. DFI.5.82 TaxID=3031725 RepID=UPI0023B0CDBD
MSQLRNLQMQINPHFLGNCFNAVYKASLTGDFEQVLALTTYLNRYFRFMAQVDNDFVLLEEELRFTDDFLSIQKLRFGDAFSYTFSVPAFLRQAR